MTEHLLWARLWTGHTAKETFSNHSEPRITLCRGNLGGKPSRYSKGEGSCSGWSGEGSAAPSSVHAPGPTVSQGKSKQPEDCPCGALHTSLTTQNHSGKEVLWSPLGR